MNKRKIKGYVKDIDDLENKIAESKKNNKEINEKEIDKMQRKINNLNKKVFRPQKTIETKIKIFNVIRKNIERQLDKIAKKIDKIKKKMANAKPREKGRLEKQLSAENKKYSALRDRLSSIIGILDGYKDELNTVENDLRDIISSTIDVDKYLNDTIGNNEPKPEPKPEKDPKNNQKPEPKPQKDPKNSQKPEAKPEKDPKNNQKPEPKPEKDPKNSQKPEPKPEKDPKNSQKPGPKPEKDPKNNQKPELKPEKDPKNGQKPEPKPKEEYEPPVIPEVDAPEDAPDLEEELKKKNSERIKSIADEISENLQKNQNLPAVQKSKFRIALENAGNNIKKFFSSIGSGAKKMGASMRQAMIEILKEAQEKLENTKTEKQEKPDWYEEKTVQNGGIKMPEEFESVDKNKIYRGSVRESEEIRKAVEEISKKLEESQSYVTKEEEKVVENHENEDELDDAGQII